MKVYHEVKLYVYLFIRIATSSGELESSSLLLEIEVSDLTVETKSEKRLRVV